MKDERGVFERLSEAGVVAVLVIDRADDAVAVAQSLLEGGIAAMELTLRTDAALRALDAIRRQVPEMLAGVGTILAPDQVRQVRDAGGDFGVAPGMNPRVVEEARRCGLPFAPGVCTPSDIERALEFELRLLKFFPAEPSGGLGYLRSIAAPYRHLALRYVPLGGVTEENLGAYLDEPLVAAVGGTWLAPRAAIQDRNWPAIRSAAARAADVLGRQRRARAAATPTSARSGDD